VLSSPVSSSSNLKKTCFMALTKPEFISGNKILNTMCCRPVGQYKGPKVVLYFNLVWVHGRIIFTPNCQSEKHDGHDSLL
jgi:hypothetical protein